MGTSLNPDDIKEGDDVYFECLVQSNPKNHKLSWFHNVSEKKTIYRMSFNVKVEEIKTTDKLITLLILIILQALFFLRNRFKTSNSI